MSKHVDEANLLYSFKYESWTDEEKFYCHASNPWEAMFIFCEYFSFNVSESIIFNIVDEVKQDSINPLSVIK